MGIVKCRQEILAPNTLAPVTTSTAIHSFREPKRDVVLMGFSSRAGFIVFVLMEKAATSGVTFRDTVCICGVIDVDARGRTFEEVRVSSSPPNYTNRNIVVWPAHKSSEIVSPFLDVCLERTGNGCALSLGHSSGRVPTDTEAEFPTLYQHSAIVISQTHTLRKPL